MEAISYQSSAISSPIRFAAAENGWLIAAPERAIDVPHGDHARERDGALAISADSRLKRHGSAAPPGGARRQRGRFEGPTLMSIDRRRGFINVSGCRDKRRAILHETHDSATPRHIFVDDRTSDEHRCRFSIGRSVTTSISPVITPIATKVPCGLRLAQRSEVV